MGTIEKIDKEIDNITNECKAYKGISKREVALCSMAKINMANEIKQIILSEQNITPCYVPSDCEYRENKKCLMDGPCCYQNKPKTKGDKIRESNESLAEWYSRKIDFYAIGEPIIVNQLNKEKFLNYINQPQEDKNE